MGLRTVFRVKFSVLAFAISAASLLASCTASDSHEKLRLAALSLNNSSIACVEEVKTLKAKYEAAPSCVALQALAQTYADLGGFGGNIPKDIEVVGERARVYAWMARAVAASGNPALTIWVVR